MKAEHVGNSPDLSGTPGFSQCGPIQLVLKSQLIEKGRQLNRSSVVGNDISVLAAKAGNQLLRFRAGSVFIYSCDGGPGPQRETA